MPASLRSPATLLLVVAGLNACGPTPDQDNDTTTGDTTDTSNPGDTSADSGDPTGTSSPTPPTTSASSDTTSDITTGAATDTTATGEPEPPPLACSEHEQGVSAAFEFTEAWFPTDAVNFTACTVDAVTIADDTIVTDLTCAAPDPQAAIMRMAATSDGAPTWTAGDAVLLRTTHRTEFDLDDVWRHFELRRAGDEALLAVGIDHEAFQPEWTAPIALAYSTPCGPEDLDLGPQVAFQLEFEFAGTDLALIEDHRGVLPIDASERFAVDVQRTSLNYCCHSETGRWQHLLIRRVTQP